MADSDELGRARSWVWRVNLCALMAAVTACGGGGGDDAPGGPVPAAGPAPAPVPQPETAFVKRLRPLREFGRKPWLQEFTRLGVGAHGWAASNLVWQGQHPTEYEGRTLPRTLAKYRVGNSEWVLSFSGQGV